MGELSQQDGDCQAGLEGPPYGVGSAPDKARRTGDVARTLSGPREDGQSPRRATAGGTRTALETGIALASTPTARNTVAARSSVPASYGLTP